jgi:hypothetical protein
MFFQQKEMHVLKKCWGIPPIPHQHQPPMQHNDPAFNMLLGGFSICLICPPHCNPHSLLKNHRGYLNTVCGLERAIPKVEMSFQVRFSQQTFFRLARCCPSTVKDGSFCCIRVGPSGFNNTCAGGPTSFTLLPSVKSTKTLWFSLLELPGLCTSENVQLSVSRLPGLPVLGPWHSNLWRATQCCIWHSVQLDIPQKHDQVVHSSTGYIIISKPITSRPYGYDPTIC